ncbi:MAG: hypothetical protein ACRC50_07040 [Gaiella sp.]
MATRADFTDEEWRELQRGITGAGMLVSASHRDFTDSFGEVTALAKKLAAEQETAQSELVRELVDVRGTGFGVFTSPHEVEDGTLAALAAASAVLQEKAPDELGTYTRLVLDVAETVAEAKGDVTSEETAAIERITGALGGG